LFLRGNRAGTKNVKTRNRKTQKIKKGEQHVASFSGFSILGCPPVFSKVYLTEILFVGLYIKQ
jgi:hypothetical protein